MIVYRTKTDIRGHLISIQNEGKTIGLVPTMGALHQGHASLVEKAAGENDIVVVTIFVNPTQFNDPSDLDQYPRTLDRDLEMLRNLEVDLVFVPSVKEMYPGEEAQVFDFGNLDKVMEGKYRAGHFKGVAQIVSKLFYLIQPDRAYFGRKDFQQLVIIKRLVEILEMNITIVECPIVREKDGLALSSRNIRLSKEARKLAPFIYETLKLAGENMESLAPEELKGWVTHRFSEQPEMELEYFEIVDDKDLMPVTDWSENVNKVGCLAVQIGGVRLIDNLKFD
jgi:pantoate--beta-alanine ligase